MRCEARQICKACLTPWPQVIWGTPTTAETGTGRVCDHLKAFKLHRAMKIREKRTLIVEGPQEISEYVR